MIFRKTALGVEEVRSRSAGLGARERSVLILVNGELAASQLAGKLGGDVRAALESLLRLRMIELVAPAAPPGRPLNPAPNPTSPPPAAPQDPELATVKSRALSVLGEVYGPDAGVMAEDLLKAGSPVQLKAALKVLEETLVMYQGRRHALELMQRIHAP